MFELPVGRRGRGSLTATILLVAATVLPGASARANPGYELDPVQPSIGLKGQFPLDVAIDQESQYLYVAELTTDASTFAHGQVEQLDASGVPTANSPFLAGAGDYFAGVAVNPVTHGIYAFQGEAETPVGNFGAPLMTSFSSSGVIGTSFNPGNSVPSLAADSLGRVYVPNFLNNTVKVFDSSGALKDTIVCTGCPGGAFDEPKSAALDSAGNLYVVDIGGERAIKFKLSGGSFSYDSVLQSGAGAVAVGVDPVSNDVFVGDLGPNGYHVVAYDAAGTQFDDFATGILGPPPLGARTAGQIAVNATTHKVYVADPSEKGNVIRVFHRVASIPAPTATTLAPMPLGQIEATLKASVNPKGHALTDCHFEYTGKADFQEHGFANAVSVPCASKPGGSTSTAVSAQLPGLSPATAYDYRVAVVSNGGAAEGSAQEFTTLPPLPPTVATGSPTAITQTKATLAASVNPRGGPISDCHFEYTDEADFQANGFAHAASAACSPKPSGTADVSVLGKATGLVTLTSYRFRVVATNNSGTAKGLDQTFVTAGETCATNPALCPPPSPGGGSSPSPLPVQPPVSPPVTSPAKKPLKCRKGFKKKKVRGKARCVKIKRRPKHKAPALRR
jgi:hypothetical protein